MQDGPKRSKRFEMVQNSYLTEFKWTKIGQKRAKKGQRGPKMIKSTKLIKIVQMVQKGPNGPKWSKIPRWSL